MKTKRGKTNLKPSISTINSSQIEGKELQEG